MTAIVSAYIPGAGFMLAADGWQTDAITGKPVSTVAQKIYFGKHSDISFAHAWQGASSVRTANGEWFSFAQCTAGLLAELQETRYESAHSFVLDMALLLQGELAFRFPGLRLFPPTMPAATLTACLFAGYFRGEPFESEIVYQHKHGLLQPYTLRRLEPFAGAPPNFYMFSGSSTVFNSTVADAPDSVQEALRVATKYIQDCEKGCGTIDDCRGIGGHIHAASVTLSETSWLVPPKGDND